MLSPPIMTDSASILLPLLRGLLASQGRFPRLRLLKAAAQPDTPRLTLPADLDLTALAHCATVLRDALETLPQLLQPGCRLVLEPLGLIAVDAPEPAATGRAAGRVALVTGAAQGFGLEIAADLVAQGAFVALADVNAEGVAQAAVRLNADADPARVIGLCMDIADPDAVKAGVNETVAAFGGIDLLVANAGVLRAGSVKTLAPRDFDFVTRVNYTGYFVCVQAVAPVMAARHAGCADEWCDIVQINSKSGLEGSNRNGAYAGSKFGGIGLTQSFALELVSDGIKVNAICPGNFFDGPLWSDPDNGLFVQYLRTGKVPGARTVADVRRFYEAKAPIGRGCTTPDVMRALYYLVEQVYETGQALPVTGGQVMLS